MEISTDWTHKERLEVIKKTSEKLQNAMRKGDNEKAFHLAECVRLVSFMPVGFLKANRSQLLESLN